MIEKFLHIKKFNEEQIEYLEKVFNKAFHSNNKSFYAGRSAVLEEAYKMFNNEKKEKISKASGIQVGMNEVFITKSKVIDEDVEFSGSLYEALLNDYARETIVKANIHTILKENDYVTIRKHYGN